MNRGKAIGYSNNISLLQDEKTRLYHEQNNKKIESLINDFMNINNLKYTDFIVCGSSGASYMDYFILNEIRDIDIYIVNKNRNNIIKTNKIDIIPYFYTNNDLLYSFKEKNNFLFLSEIDTLFSMSFSALNKNKTQTFWYILSILKNLNISIDDFIIMLKEKINILSFPLEEKNFYLNNIPFMKIHLMYINNQVKENYNVNS